MLTSLLLTFQPIVLETLGSYTISVQTGSQNYSYFQGGARNLLFISMPFSCFAAFQCGLFTRQLSVERRLGPLVIPVVLPFSFV